MIHFGQGAGAEAPVSQSCQLLPSVNFKLNPLSLSWTTEGVQETWITQCPRPTSQVERIQHGQPRGSFWSAASNEDYPAMSAKPHDPSGINERLSCDHKTAFSLEPVEPSRVRNEHNPKTKGIRLISLHVVKILALYHTSQSYVGREQINSYRIDLSRIPFWYQSQKVLKLH